MRGKESEDATYTSHNEHLIYGKVWVQHPYGYMLMGPLDTTSNEVGLL